MDMVNGEVDLNSIVWIATLNNKKSLAFTDANM